MDNLNLHTTVIDNRDLGEIVRTEIEGRQLRKEDTSNINLLASYPFDLKPREYDIIMNSHYFEDNLVIINDKPNPNLKLEVKVSLYNDIVLNKEHAINKVLPIKLLLPPICEAKALNKLCFDSKITHITISNLVENRHYPRIPVDNEPYKKIEYSGGIWRKDVVTQASPIRPNVTPIQLYLECNTLIINGEQYLKFSLFADDMSYCNGTLEFTHIFDLLA